LGQQRAGSQEYGARQQRGTESIWTSHSNISIERMSRDNVVENPCFVSGHDLSRAFKPFESAGFLAPEDDLASTHKPTIQSSLSNLGYARRQQFVPRID
jgi:hypothetical protein